MPDKDKKLKEEHKHDVRGDTDPWFSGVDTTSRREVVNVPNNAIKKQLICFNCTGKIFIKRRYIMSLTQQNTARSLAKPAATWGTFLMMSKSLQKTHKQNLN